MSERACVSGGIGVRVRKNLHCERCIGFANRPTGPPVFEELSVCDPMRVWDRV